LQDAEKAVHAAQSELNAAYEKRNVAATKFSTADKQMAVLSARIENQRKQQNQLQEDLQKRNQLAEEAQFQLNTVLEKRSALLAELTNAKAIGKELQAQETTLKASIAEIREKQSQTNRKADGLRTEHRLAKSMVDSLEGYPDSVQFLKRNAQWNANPVLLADVIQAKPEFKAAIEVALGSQLNILFHITKRMRLYTIVTIAGALTEILLSIILVRKIGICGVPVATIICTGGFVVIFNLIYGRKQLKQSVH
jgi:chromosome segregation protein